ncbi:MAG TPA: hypothetical protein VMR62_28265 [Bryobacteraceae bacterium]|jgi:hypothetical protein|nr:hypothetical protein [Bryobacteraceae bacterium]
MHVSRNIRLMTSQEKQAKRQWGTGACQVRGCITRAAYLLLETSAMPSDGGDWWQYCCPKHAKCFAERHGLEIPAAAPRRARSLIAQ